MAKRKTNADLRHEADRLWREKKAVEGELQKTEGAFMDQSKRLAEARTRAHALFMELNEARNLIEYMARYIGGTGAGVASSAPVNLEPERPANG